MVDDFLEKVACPICRQSDYDVTLAQAYPEAMTREELLRIYSSSSDEKLLDQLVRCRSCAMQYVSPRVRTEIILESYRGAKDETHWDQASSRVESFRRNLLFVINNLHLKPSRDLRLLDIGSAGGYFLKAASEVGLNAVGVEPSVWLSEKGRREFNVDLRTGTLDSCHFEPGFFSIASLWDVIEHVPDPGALLDEIHPLLAEKGHLVISYPDYGSLVRKLLGRRWPFFLNVHLYYFTRETMRKILEKHGFRVLFFKPYFLTLEAGYIIQRACAIFPWLSPLQAVSRRCYLDHLPIRYHVGQTFLAAQKV